MPGLRPPPEATAGLLRAHPRKPSSEQGVSDLMFFCLSFCQFFQLFVQGSHTVNHEGGMRSPRAAGHGPTSVRSGPERIYLRILSCTYVPRPKPGFQGELHANDTRVLFLSPKQPALFREGAG